MDSVNKKVIILGGFSNSGKGALVYCLAEVSSIYYFDDEPRFITDPDGIMSLESALVNNWNIFQSDIAIKRYAGLISTLCNKYKSPYFWRTTEKMFAGKLKKITREYISDLVEFSYNGMWTGINNPLYKIFWKINSLLKKRILKYNKTMFISMPGDFFHVKTKNYLRKLINNATPKEFDFFLLNEPFSSINPQKVLNYFHNAKLIIVQRDPRDSYCNLLNEVSEFMPNDVDKYIRVYKYMVERSNEDKQGNKSILKINFEDLVLNYDDTKQIVFDFLDIDESNHVNKFKYFDPNVSIKNVGIWKKHKNQDAIKKIYTELSEYCYRGF